MEDLTRHDVVVNNEECSTVMPVLHIPTVVQQIILDHLNLPDILNLRLACRSTFNWVSSYSTPRLRNRLAGKEVDCSTPEKLRSFVTQMPTLPFTSFEINYNPRNIATNKDLQMFQVKFGPVVQQFRTSEIGLCISDEEYNFYCSMKSLKSLSIKYPEVKQDRCICLNRSCAKCCEFLKRNLKRARIPPGWAETLTSFSFSSSNCFLYPVDIIRSCRRLKKLTAGVEYYFLYPRFVCEETRLEEMRRLTEFFISRKGQSEILEIESLYLIHNDLRSLFKRNKSVVLKFLNSLGCPQIQLNYCTRFCVDLVYANRNKLDSTLLENIVQGAKCFKGISPAIQYCEMDHLEELSFQISGPRSFIGNGDVRNWSEYPNYHPEWKNLRRVKGKINQSDNHVEEELRAMMDFLFLGPYVRPNVTEIKFHVEIDVSLRLMAQHFTINFPNLQILELGHWSHKKADYTRLFRLLGTSTRINKLILYTPVYLDDETFIGPAGNVRPPYFTRLESLETFKWNCQGYRDDPEYGITNEVFYKVFKWMKLRDLEISVCPLPKVTEKGLLALLDGPLASSIQKFLFGINQVAPSITEKKMIKVSKQLSQMAHANWMADKE